MNSKITKVLLVGLVLLMLIGTISVSAITPYTTYTYNYDGQMQLSPDAYTPVKVVDTQTLVDSLGKDGGASDNAKLKYAATAKDNIVLKGPKDIFVDELNHVYIANTDEALQDILSALYGFIDYISIPLIFYRMIL